jgi:hypothetical protein
VKRFLQVLNAAVEASPRARLVAALDAQRLLLHAQFQDNGPAARLAVMATPRIAAASASRDATQ